MGKKLCLRACSFKNRHGKLLCFYIVDFQSVFVYIFIYLHLYIYIHILSKSMRAGCPSHVHISIIYREIHCIVYLNKQAQCVRCRLVRLMSYNKV